MSEYPRCLRCGGILFSEALERYDGYCGRCYPHKKDLDAINQLQARVKELEAENKGLKEQATKAKNAVLTISKRLVKVYNDPLNQQYSLVLTSGELARIYDVCKEGGKP